MTHRPMHLSVGARIKVEEHSFVVVCLTIWGEVFDQTTEVKLGVNIPSQPVRRDR